MNSIIRKNVIVPISLIALIVAISVSLYIAIQNTANNDTHLPQPDDGIFQISQTDWSGGPVEAEVPVAKPDNRFSDSENIDYQSQVGSIFLILN